MTTYTYTRKDAIDAKCRDCNYDEYSAGTFKEQTAACVCANCPLHSFRPMPRQCRVGGLPDPVAIAAIRAKLERIDCEQSRR